MSRLLTVPEFAALLARYDQLLDYLETTQQLPFYEQLVQDDPSVSEAITGLHTAVMDIQAAGEKILKLREEGRCRDHIWQTACERALGSINRYEQLSANLKTLIDGYRAKEGLSPVGSDRPLN